MAWNNLTFVECSLLTSSKMTQLQNNFSALADQDGGAPLVVFPNSALIANAGLRSTGVGSIALVSAASGFLSPLVSSLGTAHAGSGFIAPQVSSFGTIHVSSGISGMNIDRHTPPMHIQGLVIANNSTDADHDIDIATGEARDTTDADTLALAAALTKQIDAAWAVGDDAGGMDTGAVAIDSWYHVWLIKRTDTGVVDALFSLSVSAPTMPANYDRKRLIGSVLTDGSANILGFQMFESLSGIRTYLWDDPPLDVSVTNLGTSAITYTLSVPPGYRVKASMNVISLRAADKPVVYIRNPDVNDEAPSASAAPLASTGAESNYGQSAQIEILTDTSAQISARGSAAGITLRITTLGWEE